MFDAGSTGTTMFVYSWPDNRTDDGTGAVYQVAECYVEGEL